MIASPDPALPTPSLHQALSALGERYNAAPIFPADSLAVLAADGLHRRFAPVGAGRTAAIDNTDMFDAPRAVGRADLSVGRHRASDWLNDAVADGGRVILVHWTGDTDYPQTGDGAVEALWDGVSDQFQVETTHRTDAYRLDLWVRT